jgi:hypothetical protein
MPKNSVTDPITDQEMTFAHLILSGTMNDREAAEAAGLNPTTASYTKSKPRVRDYMDQHRAAVSEKLVEQEAEGLRKFNVGRDQILARLWELANLSPAETRGSIAGQIKALSMIATMEGLFPDRRRSPAAGQPVPPPVKATMYVSEAMRRRPAEDMQPDESVTSTEAQPSVPTVPEPPDRPVDEAPSVNQEQGHTSEDDPFTYPKGVSWVPNAIGPNLDAYPKTTGTFRPPFAPGRGRFGRGR